MGNFRKKDLEMKLFGLLSIFKIFSDLQILEIFENVIFQPRLPLAMNSIRLSKKSMQLMLDGSPVTTFMKLSPLTIFQNFVELSQM